MTEQLDFIPADLTTAAAIAKWLEGVGYDPAMARFAASIATGESKGDVIQVDDEEAEKALGGGKEPSGWAAKYGTGQTNNASGSNQAGDHPNARRRKHRHPNGVEHAHVGGARPHTHDGKAGVGETKGDRPGHEFHGNQYTEGVPIGELDAERIRQATLAFNASSPPHLLEAIRTGDPEIQVHARSVGGLGRSVAVNVIPGVNTVHGFAPAEEGRLTSMQLRDGRLSAEENAARSRLGRSVQAEAQVPVRFINPDTGLEHVPGKAADGETKGDRPGHEFHGNQYTHALDQASEAVDDAERDIGGNDLRHHARRAQQYLREAVGHAEKADIPANHAMRAYNALHSLSAPSMSQSRYVNPRQAIAAVREHIAAARGAKAADGETKGDRPGHEFHGNQYADGAGARAAERYLSGMAPAAREKYTPRFTPRSDAQDAAIAQLLAKPSEGSQVVDGEQVPDAIRPSLPYEDRQDELAAAVKDHAGETRDVSVADLIATKPLLDRRAIPSTIKNLDGDPDFQRPGYLPVVAQRDGKTYVVDGHHRAEGAFLLGQPTLKVQFHDLDAKGGASGAETKGDVVGHEFHGNQWTHGSSGEEDVNQQTGEYRQVAKGKSLPWPTTEAAFRSMVVDPHDPTQTMDGKSITPETDLIVFHATTPDNGRLLFKYGFNPIDKPRNLARTRYESGQEAIYAPGAGLNSGLYVTGHPTDASGYGREMLAIRIRAGDLEAPVEGGYKDPLKALASGGAGAVISNPVPPENVERFGSDPNLIPSLTFDQLRKAATSETKGDVPGHPFHGNQYTGGQGGGEDPFGGRNEMAAIHADLVRGYPLAKDSHGWAQSKPWLASSADIAAGRFPGIKVQDVSPGILGYANVHNGTIGINAAKWDESRPQARGLMLYHELGHFATLSASDDPRIAKELLGDREPHPASSWGPHMSGTVNPVGEALADRYAEMATSEVQMDYNEGRLEPVESNVKFRDLMGREAAFNGYPSGTQVVLFGPNAAPEYRRKGVKGDVSGHPFHGNQYTGGAGSTEIPQKVTTVDEALDALGHGKGVMFERPEQVVTLLDKLAQVARDARAKGTKAPVYDLCKVSAAGTNVFCHENVNIPRSEMPQLKGKPAPGTPAYALPRTPDGGVDLGPAFRDHLSAMGHTVEQTDESAARLRASQRELDGVKVAGMMDAIAAGKLAPEPIFTSNDNYVIDGHHRWAAMVGLGLKTGQDLRLPIQRVDMPVFQTLRAATDFTTAMGVQTAALGKALAPAEMKVALEVIRGYQEKGDRPGHEFHGNQYTHVFAPSDVKVGDLTIRNSDWDPAGHAIDAEFRTPHATVDVLNKGRGTGDKVFVGGSRNYPDLGEVYRAVAALPADTLILTSATNGASAAIRQAALDRGMELQVWSPIFDQRSHEAAYFARDQEMVQASDRVMSFWDQVSRGTNFEVDYARQIGKPVTQTVRAKDVELEAKGDRPGHEFHGNQYTDAQFTAANLTEAQHKRALASLAEWGMTPEKLEQNIQATLDKATPAQLAAGKAWYAQAHAMAAAWAEKYGVSPQVAAAAIAATSPNCPWEINLKLAENALKVANSSEKPPFDAAWVAKLEKAGVSTDHYAEKNLALKDYPSRVLSLAPFSKGLSVGIGKAIDMARGESVDEILKGPKVNSFVDNITSPRGSQEVTVDVHATRLALGRNPATEKEEDQQKALVARVGVYHVMADSYREVAKANNMTPLELQAVTWVVQRDAFPRVYKEKAWGPSQMPDFGPQVLDDVPQVELDQQIALNQLDSLASPEARAAWLGLLGDTFMGDEDPYDEGNDDDENGDDDEGEKVYDPDFGWGVKSPDGTFFTDAQGVVHPVRSAEGYDPKVGDSSAISLGRQNRMARGMLSISSRQGAQGFVDQYRAMRLAGMSHQQVLEACSRMAEAAGLGKRTPEEVEVALNTWATMAGHSSMKDSYTGPRKDEVPVGTGPDGRVTAADKILAIYPRGGLNARVRALYQRDMGRFQAAGGQIIHLAYGDPRAESLRDRFREVRREVEAQNVTRRVQAGLSYVDSVLDGAADPYRAGGLVIALDKQGRPVGALNYSPLGNQWHVGLAGSASVLPGTSMAMQQAFATVAAEQGKPVTSSATRDARPAHAAWGRRLGLRDESSSEWTLQDVQEIAKLRPRKS